jgi:hypothetical protein
MAGKRKSTKDPRGFSVRRFWSTCTALLPPDAPQSDRHGVPSYQTAGGGSELLQRRNCQTLIGKRQSPINQSTDRQSPIREFDSSFALALPPRRITSSRLRSTHPRWGWGTLDRGAAWPWPGPLL